MKVCELIIGLKTLNQDAEIRVSSDEELNAIFTKFKICELTGGKQKQYCIFGLNGTELEV